MGREQELETAIKQLRRARGLAVNAGAIGITLATETEPTERRQVAQDLGDFIQRFCAVTREIAHLPIVREEGARHPGMLDEIGGFSAELVRLDQAGDFAALTRDRASELTRRARERTLPAFYAFIRAFESEKDALRSRHQDRLKEQAAQLEKMFGEVEEIGRMIHLISLNASVEAARAGGESGRSFKVIADEIRNLAQQSASLIETTRDAMLGGHEARTAGRKMDPPAKPADRGDLRAGQRPAETHG
ncbi:MAG: methyl-accepting chemotaxis protein, partial [Pseudomonadota bacterium]